MNYTGEDIIRAIVRRLKYENVRCNDTAIVNKLRTLNRYELNQLNIFGDVSTWIRDRNSIKELNR